MALLGKYARITCAIRCGGWDAYLGRVAGGGLGVLPGWCGLDGTATAPAAPVTTGGPGWVWRSRGNLPGYGHDLRVCDCVTNCVTITMDDHGLPWILGMPEQGEPAEMRWSGHYVIASGRRGRGFKSRHPDSKTTGQRLCAIEARWPWVTNCVTIGSFFRWCHPAVGAFSAVHGGSRLRLRLRVPRLGDDRDCQAGDADPPGVTQKPAGHPCRSGAGRGLF
jgi:hypothetical protein